MDLFVSTKHALEVQNIKHFSVTGYIYAMPKIHIGSSHFSESVVEWAAVM